MTDHDETAKRLLPCKQENCDVILPKGEHVTGCPAYYRPAVAAALAAAYVRGLERANELCKPWMTCTCDEAYTSRGRHESNAWHELAEEIDGAIQAEIDKEGNRNG